MLIPRSHLLWSLALHATAITFVLSGPVGRPRVFRCPEVHLLPATEPPAATPSAELPEVAVEPACFEAEALEPVPAVPLALVEPQPRCELPAEPAWPSEVATLDRTVVVRATQATEPPAAEPAASQAAVAAEAPLAPPVVLAVVPGTNLPPDYPARARRNGWQGTVLLLVRCGASGEVVAVEVISSSGHPLLDEAALAAVRRWQFSGGAGELQVPIAFHLRGNV
jgi:protein TonB